ncbi:MAG: hypothetical protein K2Q20_04690 [Phycisphaerales bacterium]|nr:hypothetical protein [Phycisphaerales bacterium]
MLKPLRDFYHLSAQIHDPPKWWIIGTPEDFLGHEEYVQRVWTHGDKPIPLVRDGGRLRADVMMFVDEVWSGRLVRLLQEHGVRGFHPHRAVIRDKSGKVLDEDVYVVRFDIGSGPVDDTKGTYLKSIFQKSKGQHDPELDEAYGLVWDTSTWTGLDVFRNDAVGRGSLIVTDQVKSILEAGDITGYELERCDLYGKSLVPTYVALRNRRLGRA